MMPQRGDQRAALVLQGFRAPQPVVEFFDPLSRLDFEIALQTLQQRGHLSAGLIPVVRDSSRAPS